MFRQASFAITVMLLLISSTGQLAHTSAALPASAEQAPSENKHLKYVQFFDSRHGWTLDQPSAGEPSVIDRTEDAGLHWSSSDLPGLRQAAFAFGDAKHGYAVGGEGCKDSSGTLVCKRFSVRSSTDSGATWVKQITEKTAKTDSSPQVIALNAEHVLVRYGTRILHSHDGGRRWLDVSLLDKQAIPYRLAFVDPGTGYAIGRIGSKCPDQGLVPVQGADCSTAIWKTTDGGTHWTKLPSSPKLGGSWSPVDIQFLSAVDGYTLYANPDTHASRLYATTDGGLTWTLRNTSLPGIRPYPVKLDFINASNGWVPIRTGAGPVDGELQSTSDGGTSFVKISVPGASGIEDSDRLSITEGWVIASQENGSGNRLLHTEDGGNVWHDRTPVK